MIEVSVIIPCYNVEVYIGRSIQSVLAQSFTEIEVICVDDGSSDKTLSILKNFQEKYPDRIKVIRQFNAGASAARNAGIKVAAGKYIQFLDADDTLDTNKISHQLTLLQNKERCFVAGNYLRHAIGSIEKVAVFSSDSWIALAKGRLGCTCSNLFLKSDIDAVGGWNEALASSQESDLMFRLIKSGCNVISDTSFLTNIYVRDSGSISAKSPQGNLERYIRLRFEMHDWLLQSGQLTTDRKSALGSNLLGALRMLFRVDNSLAKSIYNSQFAPTFEVKVAEQHSRIYVMMHKIFGFVLTQRLFRLLGK